MKEGLFILALLIVSSFAIDSRHPGHKDDKHLTPAAHAAHAVPAAHPLPKAAAPAPAPAPAAAAQFKQPSKISALQGAAAAAAHRAAAQTHAAAQAHVEVHVEQLNMTSSTGVHVKKTPGVPCDTFTTCASCTDDESLAFYCMWSPARNVCMSDANMDQMKHDFPEDLWTKQCAPKDEPITDCGGCPILAVDKKPVRNIVDSKIKGSNGDEVSAVEGKLSIIGSDPNDPVTGPITHPIRYENGTYGQTYLLPSIRDEDGNIKDPIAAPAKFDFSPCVGDGSCDGSSHRFVQSKKTGGKFTPDLLTEDNAHEADPEPRMQQTQPHVDKVEMQDAALEDEAAKNSDAALTEGAPIVDESNANTAASSELEVSSRVVTKKSQSQDDTEPAAAALAPGGGFTPTFSDDEPTDSNNDNKASSPDMPRFKQTQTTSSRRSEFKGMSAEKSATQPKDTTMEVTEFDDTVTGGKRINEDQDDKPTKEEADEKQ